MNPPEGFEDALQPYGPVLFDSCCGEPIAWGFKLRDARRLETDRFNALRTFGRLECHSPRGGWMLVTKRLSSEEARAKYGEPKVEWGPIGGFRSVTYGTTKFLSRTMCPEGR